jgi:hypothetical protein
MKIKKFTPFYEIAEVVEIRTCRHQIYDYESTESKNIHFLFLGGGGDFYTFSTAALIKSLMTTSLFILLRRDILYSAVYTRQKTRGLLLVWFGYRWGRKKEGWMK